MKRLGLGGQIAIAVAAVALLVGSVLALGTLVLGGRSFSQIMVEHGESVASAEAMFRDSVVVFFVTALVVAAAMSVALAIIVGRRVASPLAEMSEAARLLAQGNYAVRVGDRGPAEVRSLAESFNWMAREIEEQERMRREFVSNAAHELRTPLTNLQGYLEALRDGVVAAERSTFESLHEEVDRLVRLSRSLDALAEGDVPPTTSGDRREIDLRAAIVAAVDLHTAAFEKRHLHVDVDLPTRQRTAGWASRRARGRTTSSCRSRTRVRASPPTTSNTSSSASIASRSRATARPVARASGSRS
ncbi:MAG: HAMP domain-containing histidine kinase [Chloroflexi bacterium]|nr:MAG: HAMP domain-containing histidine kinase [Chloroflexota bacterium]